MVRFNDAAECFYRLLDGEHVNRDYLYSSGNEYGYFYDPTINRWVVFDNRMNTMFIATCRSVTAAEKLLTDGTELLPV